MIMRDMGGLGSYSLLFTSYLVSSTLFMPLWGRGADRHGRKWPLMMALLLFLAGSLIAGIAQSLPVFLAARVIQGTGASGIIPLSFTAIADSYSLEERTRLQGYLSGTWGIASLIGPYIGGALAESYGWRWVFYINLIPGVVALLLIYLYYHEARRDEVPQAASLASIICSIIFVGGMLAAIEITQMKFDIQSLMIWGAVILSLTLFISVERHAAHPLIPRALYSSRIFIVGCLSGFFSSGMIIGLASYSPLFFQSILGYSATESGLLLAPFSVAWVLASIPATRMLLKHDRAHLIITGHFLCVVCFALFICFFDRLSTPSIVFSMIIGGIGMAYNYPPVLISIQHSVPRQHVGFATSGLTWIRNQGAALFTAVMGAYLVQSLGSNLGDRFSGRKSLMNPELLEELAGNEALRAALMNALKGIFIIMGILTVLALLVALSLKNDEKNLHHNHHR